MFNIGLFSSEQLPLFKRVIDVPLKKPYINVNMT